MKFAVIAVGYNRPNSMMQLLETVCSADYEENEVDLIISVDKGERQEEVVRAAKKFDWKHGKKYVYEHKERQGLRKHILLCGDFTEKYDAVVVLEDDLLVSPFYFHYVKQAVEKYGRDDRIAGISLYKHTFHPGVYRPFEPEHNGYDAFMMQFAQSWGQCWTKRMWLSFREWYQKNEEMDLSEGKILPAYISNWNQQSWLKYYMRYIVEEDKFFVYPMISLSSNASDAGEHCAFPNNDYQVPLLQGKMDFRFPSFEDSVKYDVYFERIGIADSIFSEYNGKKLLDFYGIRNNYEDAEYIISTNELPYKKVKRIGLVYRPVERNCIFPIEGEGAYLYDLRQSGALKKGNKDITTRYDVRGIIWKRLLHLGISSFLFSLKTKLRRK